MSVNPTQHDHMSRSVASRPAHSNSMLRQTCGVASPDCSVGGGPSVREAKEPPACWPAAAGENRPPTAAQLSPSLEPLHNQARWWCTPTHLSDGNKCAAEITTRQVYCLTSAKTRFTRHPFFFSLQDCEFNISNAEVPHFTSADGKSSKHGIISGTTQCSMQKNRMGKSVSKSDNLPEVYEITARKCLLCFSRPYYPTHS